MVLSIDSSVTCSDNGQVIHGWLGILKILAATLGSAALIGLIVGFYSNRRAGWRAFSLLLPLCLLMGGMQIVSLRYVPGVLVVFAVWMFLAWRRVRTRAGDRR